LILKGGQNAHGKKEHNIDRAACNARTASGSILGLRLDRYCLAAFRGKMRLVLQEFEAGLGLYIPSRAYQSMQTSPVKK
jgi:hypothetical protein